MIKEWIELKEKCIVLGIFGTNTYNYFRNKPGVIGYNVFNAWYIGDVMHCVHNAAIWAEQIIFVLDDVKFPINILESITCQELALICSKEDLYNKTVFVKGDNVIEFDRNLIN